MDAAVERLRAQRNAERASRYANRNTAPMAPVVVSQDGSVSADSGALGWFIFGMLLPPLGFITWLCNHKDLPNNCKRVIKGVIAGIVTVGLFLCASFALYNATVRTTLASIEQSYGLEYGMPTLSGGTSQDGEFTLTPADEYDVVMA